MKNIKSLIMLLFAAVATISFLFLVAEVIAQVHDWDYLVKVLSTTMVPAYIAIFCYCATDPRVT